MKAIVIKGDKITPQDIENSIDKVQYVKLGKKIMVCHITLCNKHEVTGQAGVVDPLLFDQAIGEKISYSRAVDEVYKHLGSVFQNQIALEFGN